MTNQLEFHAHQAFLRFQQTKDSLEFVGNAAMLAAKLGVPSEEAESVVNSLVLNGIWDTRGTVRSENRDGSPLGAARQRQMVRDLYAAFGEMLRMAGYKPLGFLWTIEAQMVELATAGVPAGSTAEHALWCPLLTGSASALVELGRFEEGLDRALQAVGHAEQL